MTELSVEIKLDTLVCNKSGEKGSAEPYMWTVFFKADGDTLAFNSSTLHLQTTKMVTKLGGGVPFHVDNGHHGHKPQPGHPVGKPHPVVGDPEPTVQYTIGNEGDLGTSSVQTGQTVNIPASIGQWDTVLRPIPITPPLFGKSSQGGIIGCIVVLMEEDNTPNDAIQAGHGALNSSVFSTIASVLKTFTITNLNIDDKAIEQMKAAVATNVTQAVKNNVSGIQWLWGLGDMDDQLGTQVWLIHADQLAEQRTIPLSQRWGQPGPNNPQGGSDGDWEVSGHVKVLG